jgi:hypothetical protein
MAFNVRRQRREYGIRLALCANASACSGWSLDAG